MMAAIKYDIAHIDKMDGHEFEHFIAALLRKLGYLNVEVTRGSGDQGVDVLAEKEGVRYAVQCKCYSSDLGNTPVQEVNTGRVIYHCHVGVVVTNQHFTQSAKAAAKATGVLLWDRARLQELMTQAELMSQSVSNEDALLKRGYMALEDGEWHKADSFFEQVLNLNAECGEAYSGKVLAATQSASLEELQEKMVQLDTIKDFSRAIRFSSGAQLQALQEVHDIMQEKWQEEKAAERLRKEEEARIVEEQRKALQAKLEAERRREEEEARIAEEQKEAWAAKMSPFWKHLHKRSLIDAGDFHTVGLKADGTVITVGFKSGQPGWNNIASVTAGRDDTVGLKADGTVVIFSGEGETRYGADSISGWTSIVAVACGWLHTVGLKRNGTVVAMGFNYDYGGECNVSGWMDIIKVAAGWSYTVGLKSDGTVVTTGENDCGQCNVASWKNIVSIAAKVHHTVGLKSDGTVVATGENKYGQCNVSGWERIVEIEAGYHHTVGLRDDGTVVAVGSNNSGQCNVSGWKNIIAIAAGESHTVGLMDDGTVVAVGSNVSGKCNVSDWKLFNSIQEHIFAKLEQERSSLQTELAKLGVFFSGRRRREIEARLTEIYMELEDLHQ